MVLCAAAWISEGAHAWPAIERIYLDLSDTIATLGAPDTILQCPDMPPPPKAIFAWGWSDPPPPTPPPPWLATIILPSFFTHPHPHTITWIPDFTQCLTATAILMIR